MSVTYKVTARSGLNVRSSPNGSKFGAIPYGRTVTGDGKTSGGWYHVQWNGRWGYSYGNYLQKVSESKPSVVKMAAAKPAAKTKIANTVSAAQIEAEKREATRAGKLASFGTDLIFEVSSRKVLPAKSWKRRQDGRWAEHDIIGSVPRSEFLGPDRTETTLTVTFNAEWGVKPRAMIATVEKLIRTGKAEYLVLGGQIYGWGGHKFILTGASESWNRIMNRGELAQATMDLTFQEYW